MLERLAIRSGACVSCTSRAARARGARPRWSRPGSPRPGCGGRYASPHVERLNERVVVNGIEIGDAERYAALERALDAREALVRERPEVDPTWFDVVTAAALLAFRTANVERMWPRSGSAGGSTRPTCSTARCASSRTSSSSTPRCSGTRTTRSRRRRRASSSAAARSSRACRAGAKPTRRSASARRSSGCQSATAGRGAGELATAERNRRVAGAVLGRARPARGGRCGRRRPVRGVARPRNSRAGGLAGAAGAVLGGGRAGLGVDGAHTPESVGALLSDLGRDPALAGRPTVVLGLAKDKDLAGILKRLAPATERSFCTSIGTDLHRSAAELAEALSQVGALAIAATPPAAALEQALAHARARGGWVLDGRLVVPRRLSAPTTDQSAQQAGPNVTSMTIVSDLFLTDSFLIKGEVERKHARLAGPRRAPQVSSRSATPR